ncbi:hypothetical protein AXG93_2423s1280 [Marchantia polymorpha subsp. ruderalis]|uniref:Serine hydrolase domain-containing protein n=1 Tax=Marchantia polymorpha subsp. ruderalis TaxID=1480154 RepID=A0A176VNN8_MARPO|nr:hypothetical protein AXG93_2423s1280 [Marchantia polymorpha subsp. ruderalis]
MAANDGSKVPASSSGKPPGKSPSGSSSSKKADSSAKANPPSRKLRVLCLHGLRTSAKIMQQQVELAQWALEDIVEFVYMNAPFPATGKSDVEKRFEPPYFEWYQANQDYSEIYGLEEASVHIIDFIKTRGPFDGLMGFSQKLELVQSGFKPGCSCGHNNVDVEASSLRGAVLAGALVGLQEKGLALPDVPRFTFIVLIGGCRSKALVLRPAYFDPILTPSLHFIGEKDFMKEGGELLITSFKDATVIHHPHGHLIPRLGDEELKTCRAYFQKYFDLKFSPKS